MIKLDENLLIELGLGALPKDEKTSFLKHMYETLEMRVGTRLAERMSDQQMSEFEQFITSNDEQGAFHWLESNFPNYKEVVAEEFEKLKGEIRPMAADILAASQAQQQHMQPGQQFQALDNNAVHPTQAQPGYAQPSQPGQTQPSQPTSQTVSSMQDQPTPQQQYQQPVQQPTTVQQASNQNYSEPQSAQQMQPQPMSPQGFQQPVQMPSQQYSTPPQDQAQQFHQQPQQPPVPGHHPQYPQQQGLQNPQTPPQQ